jgi:hypothetical protein
MGGLRCECDTGGQLKRGQKHKSGPDRSSRERQASDTKDWLWVFGRLGNQPSETANDEEASCCGEQETSFFFAPG